MQIVDPNSTLFVYSNIFVLEGKQIFFIAEIYRYREGVGWRGGGLDTRHLNNKFLRSQKLDIINIPYFIFGITQDTRKQTQDTIDIRN